MVELHHVVCRPTYGVVLPKKCSQEIQPVYFANCSPLCEVVSGNVRSSQFVEYNVVPLAYCEIFGNFVQSFYEDFFF